MVSADNVLRCFFLLLTSFQLILTPREVIVYMLMATLAERQKRNGNSPVFSFFIRIRWFGIMMNRATLSNRAISWRKITDFNDSALSIVLWFITNKFIIIFIIFKCARYGNRSRWFHITVIFFSSSSSCSSYTIPIIVVSSAIILLVLNVYPLHSVIRTHGFSLSLALC